MSGSVRTAEPDRLWDIIERCISLEAKDRYTAEELIGKLDDLGSG